MAMAIGAAFDLLSFPAAGAAATHRHVTVPSDLAVAATAPKPGRRLPRLAAGPLFASPAATSPAAAGPPSPAGRWVVAVERPPAGVGGSRREAVDYFVETLARVLGSEREAQMCIYDADWEGGFRFRCEILEEESRELARLPGVLSVGPDTDEEYGQKDYKQTTSLPKSQVNFDGYNSRFSSSVKNNNYWLVRIEKPGVEVVTKAQMVDYYAKILTRVLGNEQDAQVCIYNISWEKDYGFCCHIDEDCARELADVPGVLSVHPDANFASDNKDYRGHYSDPSESNQIPNIRTKRLFVTGLSFYTSEKTLRAAFEGYGELVEVKIIMDKISKRSKGYAFIEYTTEEAAGAALKEMNGKIINGWMIVVDAARTNPPRNSRERPRQSSSSTS